MKSAPRLADATPMSSETLVEPQTEPPPASSRSLLNRPRATPSPAADAEPSSLTSAGSSDEDTLQQELDELIAANKRRAEALPEEDVALATPETEEGASLAPTRRLAWPLRLLVGCLAILDLPFAFLGPTVKTLLGWLAIGTALLAMAVWVYGPKLAGASSAAGVSTHAPADVPAAAPPTGT